MSSSHPHTLLRRLSNAIRPSIGLPPANDDIAIDLKLAEFAVHRHRVGTALHLATAKSGLVNPDAADLLTKTSRDEVLKSLSQKASIQKLGQILSDESIAYLILKGSDLAGQLYDNPAVRSSKDIDVLIPKADSVRAVTILNSMDYRYIPMSLRKAPDQSVDTQLAEMARNKDITFVDPEFEASIELHQRLFTSEPETLTTEIFGKLTKPVPDVRNPHYALYLILHGALVLWPRLKWIGDLSSLARILEPENRIDLLQLASRFGCENAIAASLAFAEEIFPGSLDDHWKSYLDEHTAPRKIASFISKYRRTLGSGNTDAARMPDKNALFFDASIVTFGSQISKTRVVVNRIKNSIAIRV